MNKIKLNKLLHSIDKLESVDSIFIHEKKNRIIRLRTRNVHLLSLRVERIEKKREGEEGGGERKKEREKK